jgi:hypothetical protein
MGCEIILEIEDPDHILLPTQGKTKDGTRSPTYDVWIRTVAFRLKRVVNDNGLLGPDDVVQERFRQFAAYVLVLPHVDGNTLSRGDSFGRDPHLTLLPKKQKTAHGSRMFDDSDHQSLDEPLQDYFPGKSLRHLHDGGEI